MLEAVVHGEPRVCLSVRTVHRLYEEVPESEILEALWFHAWLRENNFQLIAALQDEFGARLRANADPVDAFRGELGSVSLDRHLEADAMQIVEQWLIQLQQGFAASAHYKWSARCGVQHRPGLGDRFRQLCSGREAPASRTASSQKVGVAEATDCYS